MDDGMKKLFSNKNFINKLVLTVMLVLFSVLPINANAEVAFIILNIQVIIKLLLSQEVVFINLRLGELKVDTVGLITVEKVAMQREKYI